MLSKAKLRVFLMFGKVAASWKLGKVDDWMNMCKERSRLLACFVCDSRTGHVDGNVSCMRARRSDFSSL